MSDLRLDHVASALKENNYEFLLSAFDEFKLVLRSKSFLKEGELFSLVGPAHNQLNRNFSAETYIPTNIVDNKNRCLAIRSETSGNCLYSSVSLALVGNNSLINLLRVLNSLELFLNASFYYKHPCLVSIFDNHKEITISYDSLFSMILSHDAIDSGSTGSLLVQREAVLNFENKSRWSSFILLLSLSSVINRKILTYYPDFGLERWITIFTQHILPRTSIESHPVHILFCHEGTMVKVKEFKHNHYVPLAFEKPNTKRKLGPKNMKAIKVKKVNSDQEMNQTKISFWGPMQNRKPDKRMFTPASVVQSVTKSEFSHTLTTAVATSKSCYLPAVPSPLCSTSHSFLSSASSSYLSTSFSSLPISFTNVETSGKNKLSSDSDILKYFKPVVAVSSSEKDSQFGTDSMTAIEASNSQCPDNDIANFVNIDTSTMENAKIYESLSNIFFPDKDFNFPVSTFGKKKKESRKFRFEWFEKFPWLCYSPRMNGAFCLTCVFFGKRFPSKCAKINALFTKPFHNWPDASSHFNQHQRKDINGLHKATFFLYDNFLKQMTGKLKSIDVIIDKQLQNRISDNRKKLVPIVDTVILCGRTGVPLRGHRDDSQYHPSLGDYSKGSTGNFIEFLNFAIRRGDTLLKNHLSSCSKNATYISGFTQNEIIKCCGTVITDEILEKVKIAKFYTIIADECSDSSHKEQLSLVIRYVNAEMEVKEDFVRFLHCSEGLSGQSLFNVLMKCIKEDLKLNIMNCRGQAYDGAGSVAGKNKGLSTLVKAVNSKALYTHCFSHVLNLSIQKGCTVPPIRDMLSEVKELCYFYKFSEGRQNFLIESIDKLIGPDSKKRLKDVCRTRWVERVKGLREFEEMFIAVVDALERMNQNLSMKVSNENSGRAGNHLKAITNFQFIASLVLTRCVFDLTLPVTQLLQSKTLDIYNGLNLIQALKNSISSVLKSVEKYHNKWYQIAIDLAKSVFVEERKPRTCGRQAHRSNVQADSASDYFRKTVTQPLLEFLIVQLSSRFNDLTMTPYYGLSVIPSNIFFIKHFKKQVCWKEEFKVFANFYTSDFPNFSGIDSELKVWEEYWKLEDIKPDTVSNTLKLMPEGFENIKVALLLLATLPVTSCSCERSFSAMKRLKDYARNTMGSDRLNGLALMYIHKDIVPDFDKVIEMFSLGNRRLELR